MALMFPDTKLDNIPHVPERLVAQALMATLGPRARVYHSYPWLRPYRDELNRELHLAEGEIDFVVVEPDRGLLVLEVKGGNVEFDPVKGGWYRLQSDGEKKPLKDPFKQASRNMHNLIEQIKEREPAWRKGLPFAYGFAAILPTHKAYGPPPPGAENGNFWDQGDLAALGTRIRRLLERFSHGEPRPLSDEDLKKIHVSLYSNVELIEVLSYRLDEQETVLERLTIQQINVLRGFATQPRMLVAGVAGSGKTLLARARAQSYAAEGLATLLLCYNRGLAEWLRKQVPEELKSRLKVWHFHGLCRDLCRQAHVPFQPPEESNPAAQVFWTEQAATLLEQAIDRIPDRYQAIVVDEGQDFHDHWWFPIEMLNAEVGCGPFYIFFDADQTLYLDQKVLALPSLPFQFVLPTNCRNTQRIAAHCGNILGRGLAPHPLAPVGDEPRITRETHPERRKAACAEQIRKWISQGQLRPDQVAILCPRTRENSCLAKVNSLEGIPLTERLEDWWEGKGVLFKTIRGFKGLEADAMILVDVPPTPTLMSNSDLYVGCSRAKHILHLIYNE